MISVVQRAELIQAIREVAKKEILPRFRRLSRDQVSTKSGFDDLVTEADIASERSLVEVFEKIVPNALIVGEEAVSESAAILDRVDGEGLVIIIDPIDGTWNFAHGLSTFGVLVSVVHNGETVFGVQYDPVNDDWIEATKGMGCFYMTAAGESHRIELKQQASDERLVGFLSPFQFNSAQAQLNVSALQMNYARALSLRCCCHEYRTLVQGGADFYVSPKPRVWDHAAGILCYEEAGGVVQMLDGAPYRPTVRDGVIVAGRTREIVDRIQKEFHKALEA